MNKKELIKHIARKTGLSLEYSRKFLNAMLREISQSLAKGEPIRIRKFGNWSTKDVHPRTHYDVVTRQIGKTTQKRKVSFRSSPSFVLPSPQNTKVSLLVKERGYLQQALSPISKDEKGTPLHSSKTSTITYTRSIRFTNIRKPHKGLNLGPRASTNHSSECKGLEYLGTTTYEQVDPIDTEKYSYPALLVPFKDTPILKYSSRQYATEGIVEPILAEALQRIKGIEPEIEILRDISLPVLNRNYGYKPDIAITWRSKNIFIDIEIDEPYDIVSRGPIHYMGCGDSIRNAYFLNNGWTVIRVAEKQIVDECQKIVDFIKGAICQLTSDKRFRVELSNTITKRWQYDEAKKWAEEKYREEYLGIKHVISTQEHFEEDDMYRDDMENTEFIKPAEDIIEDRFESTRQAIDTERKKASYILFSLKNKSYDYVAYSNDIVFGKEGNFYGVRLHDIIENKEVFLQFPTIESFHATNDIVRQTVAENDRWDDILWEAILDSNPIEISYDTAGQGHPVTRTLLYLTPWYELYNNQENRKNHSTLTLLEVGNSLKFSTLATMNRIGYFTAFCTYRQDIRTFSAQRIKSGKIFNCHKNPHEITVNDVWKVLESGHAEMVERMYHSLSKYQQSNLYHLGNYANALAMQGKVKEALDIYLSVPKERQMTNSAISWHEACAGDIKSFMAEGKHEECFWEIWKELQKRGW